MSISDASLATELAPVAVPVPIADRDVSSERVMSAPLPGVIKSIAVRVGQKIAYDDKLFVIEAMKMDNVIRSRRDGTVGDVLVSEGRQVAYGDPLIEFKD